MLWKHLDGQACVIFTVIIHPDFYRRAYNSQTFMNFLLMLIYEGLENKYSQFKLDPSKFDRLFSSFVHQLKKKQQQQQQYTYK